MYSVIVQKLWWKIGNAESKQSDNIHIKKGRKYNIASGI